jgi:hypothetical protein
MPEQLFTNHPKDAESIRKGVRHKRKKKKEKRKKKKEKVNGLSCWICSFLSIEKKTYGCCTECEKIAKKKKIDLRMSTLFPKGMDPR